MRMPLPHSRSPKKTFLQSPARRNPSLGPLSSPSRGSIIVPRGPPESISVRRRLDFSNENYEGSMAEAGAKGRSSQKGDDVRATIRAGRGKAVQPTSMKSPNQDDDGYDEYDDPQAQYYENGEDPNQITEGGDDEVDQVESEAEPEPEPPKKSKGKGKAKEPEAKPSEAKKGRGRKKRDSNVAGLDESEALTKKTRRSLESAKATTTGKSRNTATKELKAKTAPTKGRKPKTAKTNLAPIAENDSPAVQRGPPMPRNNRGLIILRRETPMDSDGFKTTRSGRNSVRPVQFWKNERIEYSDDENEHNGGDKFLLPRVKGVVRVDEVEEPRKRRQYHKSNKGKKRPVAVESEEEDEIEPWEMNPGRLVGEIRIWDPEDQTGMHAEEAEEEIALSSTAIVMKDTAGTFKFAKTLSTPFFATGMVDLPPGAEKKPKNSRKMQMVFFVFYGRVEVTVNDNKFRIGKGGMWQVPRGQYKHPTLLAPADPRRELLQHYQRL